ncbi:MAG: pyridoxal-phosphate dependent enzyme [Hyphomicrobiales bacterium]|nr:pyridoxal-phosphate dependent enzyme [Hyphomicrobiales bacterium]
MTELIQLQDIEAARAALPSYIRRTPIVPLARESSEIGAEKLFLKCENLQVTGAYKVRAASTMLNALADAERARGVVLTSSGNFAQAFAYAGRSLNVPITVVMLDHTSAYKVAATKGHGADVYLCGTDALQRQPTVRRLATERGLIAIDTWEEPPITAGHGSIGLEIVEDFEEVEQVLVPVSSGGVAAGIATAVKERRPDIKVIGVQPERANAAYVSLERGEPTAIDYWDTIADGLSAVRPGEFPFRHLQRYLDDIVLIREVDIANAFGTLLTRAKLLGEPAGVVAAAAFLAGKVDPSLTTVAALTGGNLTPNVMQRLLDMAETE